MNDGNGSIRHLGFAVSKININIILFFNWHLIYIEVIIIEINIICVLKGVLNQAVNLILREINISFVIVGHLSFLHFLTQSSR